MYQLNVSKGIAGWLAQAEAFVLSTSSFSEDESHSLCVIHRASSAGRKHIDCRTRQAYTHSPACYLLCGVDIPPIWHLRGGGGVETGKAEQSRAPSMRSRSNSTWSLSRRRQSPASVITHTHSSLLIFASRRTPSREHILPPNFLC